MKDFKEDIKNSLGVLKSGGIIIYPTDTIWGIGCDATDAHAIDKIYKIKERDPLKSMIILIENINQVFSYVEKPPEQALDIMEISKEPVTIVFDQAKNLPLNLLAEDKSIAIRLVEDNFCKNLIRELKKPLVSTSANFSGKESPLNFIDIERELLKKADYIVDYKQKSKRYKKASSVIRIRNNGVVEILRK